MERTDWLDGGLDSAAARFLMMTAITHHEFSSPSWGEHEVRKLHAELAELDRLAAQAVVDHAGSGPRWRRANIRLIALLLSPYAGLLVDRYSKRHVLRPRWPSAVWPAWRLSSSSPRETPPSSSRPSPVTEAG